jgi:RimJ/RimL family protein N-acetyltransferase
VFVDGRAVGVQALTADHFAATRTVTTGSWLGRAHQGLGIGKEMRAAILHLAFEGLGAERAESAAFADNAPSFGTSRALGYTERGRGIAARRGRPESIAYFRLERADWAAQRRDDITLTGLEPCRSLFVADS